MPFAFASCFFARGFIRFSSAILLQRQLYLQDVCAFVSASSSIDFHESFWMPSVFEGYLFDESSSVRISLGFDFLLGFSSEDGFPSGFLRCVLHLDDIFCVRPVFERSLRCLLHLKGVVFNAICI